MGYSEALEQQLRLINVIQHGPKMHHMVPAVRGGTQTIDDTFTYVMRALQRCEPIYWDARWCDFVIEAAKTIPEWVLTPEALIVPSGFMWFAKSLPLPRWEQRTDVTAISWFHDPAKEGTLVSSFSRCDEAWGGELDATVFWDFGEPMWKNTAYVNWLEPDRQPDIVQERAALVSKYVSTCLAFLSQEIFYAPKERIDRASAKRLEKSGMPVEPLVRVIKLRRLAQSHENSTREVHIEYSCQWVVRGHWRNQWYASLSRHQPKWITPYVKGPEDKPLKPPRATVFAVVR